MKVSVNLDEVLIKNYSASKIAALFSKLLNERMSLSDAFVNFRQGESLVLSVGETFLTLEEQKMDKEVFAQAAMGIMEYASKTNNQTLAKALVEVCLSGRWAADLKKTNEELSWAELRERFRKVTEYSFSENRKVEWCTGKLKDATTEEALEMLEAPSPFKGGLFCGKLPSEDFNVGMTPFEKFTLATRILREMELSPDFIEKRLVDKSMRDAALQLPRLAISAMALEGTVFLSSNFRIFSSLRDSLLSPDFGDN